jgi:hypothetical protein
VEDWTRAIWSDKTKSNKIGSNGWIDVWQKRGELLQTHINFPRFLPIFPDFLE